MKRYGLLAAALLGATAFAFVPTTIPMWRQFQQDALKPGTNGVDFPYTAGTFSTTSVGVNDSRSTVALSGGQTITTFIGWRGRVFFGTPSGDLVGYDFTSTNAYFNWTTPNLGDDIKCTPAVANLLGYDHVICGSDDGYLYWFDEEGNTEASVNLGAAIRGPITLDETDLSDLTPSENAYIYVTLSDGDVVRVKAYHDGMGNPGMAVDWTYANGAAAEGVTMALGGEMCYFVDSTNELVAVYNDTENGHTKGTLAWSESMGSGNYDVSRVPLLSASLVVAWYGRYVKAYDVDDGDLAWSTTLFSDQGTEYKNRIVGGLINYDNNDVILTAYPGFYNVDLSDGSVDYSVTGADLELEHDLDMCSYPVMMGDEDYVALGLNDSETTFFGWDGVSSTLTSKTMPGPNTGKTIAFATGAGTWSMSPSRVKKAIYYVLDNGTLGRLEEVP